VADAAVSNVRILGLPPHKNIINKRQIHTTFAVSAEILTEICLQISRTITPPNEPLIFVAQHFYAFEVVTANALYKLLTYLLIFTCSANCGQKTKF